MISNFLRYVRRSLITYVAPRHPLRDALTNLASLLLVRGFFSSVRLGRPLLAGLATGVGILKWLRRERAAAPRVVAMSKKVRPGQAYKLRYMDGKTVVREDIVEG